MVQIVVSDSSVLMDLARTGLIEYTGGLPFDFIIPNTMFAEELLDLGEYSRDQLLKMGFALSELSGNGFRIAQSHMSEHKKLSIQDCFALALAQEKDAILMTGDGLLRKVSQKNGVETHGVLWFSDLIEKHQLVANEFLRDCLLTLQQHPATRLPKKELQDRIDRLGVE
ncbi:hypothetical protein GCM10011332_29320 [Terasakiella brassicae]|uniref:PIN domain-containing protein n=1 Tax=Terasakiella brassicae TaxID=1634917 RepID=A0A917FEE0_9PROT|nr:hypothetical protein [Terasakiella brassicae]GGF73387.1 hypothetical protein GCM10011332_29320 [Terasakiella brassicae]